MKLPVGILFFIIFVSLHQCSAINGLQIISRASNSTATANNDSGGDPLQTEASSNGRYTVFASYATNLNIPAGYLPYNTQSMSQIYIYDALLDFIRPVTYNYASTSIGGNSNSRRPSVSDDGCLVTYESQSTNLLSSTVTGTTWRIYLTNVCVAPTTSTVMVSIGASTDSFRPRISDNGNVVIFDSASSGIVTGDTNGASDVFRYNISTTFIDRISFKTSVPTRELQGDSTAGSINADGTKVAFLTTARNAFDASNGTVVAQVIYTTIGTTTFTCITCSGVNPSSGASRHIHLSSTGAYVVWSTAPTIFNYSQNAVINAAVENVFWKNITAGGDVTSANAYSTQICLNGINNTLNSNSYWPQVSDTGNLVFFTSDASNVLTLPSATSPIIQIDGNGATDIFVRNIASGVTSLVSQRNGAVSSGNGPSYYPSISRDGSVIVYSSGASNLVSNDTNGKLDVFYTTLVNVQLPACYCTLNNSGVGNCTYNCTNDAICAPNENSGICVNATNMDCMNCTINGKCDCIESETCADCNSTVCTPNGICGLNENYHNCPADCHLCTVDSNCTSFPHTKNCTVLACDGCLCRETTPNTTCIALYTGELQCLNYTICDATNTTGMADANGCVYVLKTTGSTCDDGYNCTFNDQCQSNGQCQGSSNITVCNTLYPKTCLTKACAPFSNATSFFFDPISGCSYNRTNSSCNDNANCTTEYCDETNLSGNATTGCVFNYNTTYCNLLFPQTCLSSVTCDPGNMTASYVDPGSGCAIYRNNATCATGLICTQRYCNESNPSSNNITGCYTILTPGGTVCEPFPFTCTDALCDGLGNCQQVNNNTKCPQDGTICSIETCDPSNTGGDDYNSTTGCYNQVMTPGTPCETDGYICTMDVCTGASCAHVANNSLCHPFPGIPPFEYAACSQAVCEPGMNGTYVNNTYGCHFRNQAANTSCDDFFTCTNNDVCSGTNFACNGTNNDTVCDPMMQNSVSCIDNVCLPRTVGSNSTTGCLTTNSTSGPCDDGIPCTIDMCNASGICEGTPNATYCDNLPPGLNNSCITGVCNITTGCVYNNEPNGTACDNDTFTCTIQYCDGSSNCLIVYDNATCATGDPCVLGICDPSNPNRNATTGCYYLNTTLSCDDGFNCTYNDTCNGGVCSGTNNNTFCANIPPALGNVCVSSVCNPSGGGHDAQGCIFTNNTDPCNDGKDCTFPDVCTGGMCVVTPNDGYCVAQANLLGQCLNATCTPSDPMANITSGCLFMNLTAGTNCSDGQPCTYNDTCSINGCNGINNDTYCANLPPALNNVCVIGTCNGTSGCQYTSRPSGFNCTNDTFTCTTQQCDGSGNCITTYNNATCDTGDTCILGICDPTGPGANSTTGCRFINTTNSCSDGFTCTTNDTCSGGVCIGTPNNATCDPSNVCIDFSCNITAPGRDPITGCLYSNNTNSCDDGFTCTFPDVCSGGVCTTTQNNGVCQAEAQTYDQCLNALCNPTAMGANVTSGCLFFNLTSNEVCNDTIFCTLSDGCVNGTCVGTPDNATCESIPPGLNNDCIIGYCDPITDCYFVNVTNGTSCDNDTFTCTTQLCDGLGGCITTYNNATCATGDPCVLGICDPNGPGVNMTTGCYYINTTVTCDDGFNCTYNDTCSAGVCAGITNDTYCDTKAPSLGDVCVTGTCSPSTVGHDSEGCYYFNNTDPCDDGIQCTDDTCMGGVCIGTPNNSTCSTITEQMGVCADAFCDPGNMTANVTTGCVITAAPANTSCTDPHLCTINDVCINSTFCEGTPSDAVCEGLAPALGNPCIIGQCMHEISNLTSGCIYTNEPDNTTCTNDTFTCTTQACVNGTCITTYHNETCATGDPCIMGICDPNSLSANATTGCRYEFTTSPCNDNKTCTSPDTCFGGVCIGTPNNSSCPSGDPCVTGICNVTYPGSNNVTGCYFVNNTASCNDNRTCTTNDTCVSGVCLGTPVDSFCQNLAPICQTGICNITTGNNVTGCIFTNSTSGTNCTDGIACTDNDQCNGFGQCNGTPNNSSCPSTPCASNYCNATLGCIASNTTSGVPCDNDTFTCTTQTCDGLSNCITIFNNSLCPPSPNQCIAVVCAPYIGGANTTTGCFYGPYPNGTSCNDGFSCTSNDYCDGNGTCIGTSSNSFCEAFPPGLGNPCVTSVCNVSSPSANLTTGCVYSNNTNGCNDGYSCTNNDTCINGVCAGTPDNTTCIAEAQLSGQCQSGICNPQNISANATTGCVFQTLNAGESCNDGVACTFPDICNNTGCFGTPNNSFCFVNNSCIDYQCDPILGCVYTNKTAGTSCDSDTFSCTTQTCNGFGVCVTTYNNVTCATGNVCQDGFCDPNSFFANPLTGCRYEFNTIPCDDGYNCTTMDFCNGNGMCIGSASDAFCNNLSPSLNDPCIDGTCSITNPGRDNVTGCFYFNTTNPCDDGFTCTINDTCNGIGTCVGTDDNVTCIGIANMMAGCVLGICEAEDPFADPDTGCIFTNLTMGQPCDDGISCTFNDSCTAFGCMGTGNDTACGSFNQTCSVGMCDTMAGCFSQPLANNTACNIDNFTCTYQLCNGNNTCVTYFNNSVCPPTGNVCQDNICDPGSMSADLVTGCRIVNNSNSCDDGFSCTHPDTCSGGVCIGTPVDFDCENSFPSAGNPCVDGFCNITAPGHNVTTGCYFINTTSICSDNFTCTSDVCSGGVCMSTPDNTSCILEGILQGYCGTGICSPQNMSANATTGCIIFNGTVGNSCNDGQACTINDVCDVNQTCVGTPNNASCAGFNSSCAIGYCDIFNGCTQTPLPNNTQCNTDTYTCTYQLCNGNNTCITYYNDSVCTGGNGCQTGICDPTQPTASATTGCYYANVSNSCDDGIACTVNDTCINGICTGILSDIYCQNTPPAFQNSCVTGVCDPNSIFANATGCVFSFNNAPCDDGFNCTYNDVCFLGQCNGVPNNTVCENKSPASGNPCIDGTCNILGMGYDAEGCVFTNNTQPCDDGIVCSVNDTCTNGSCIGVDDMTFCPNLASMMGQCKGGTCDPTNTTMLADMNGCVFTNLTMGQPCNDSIPCTFNDTCNANATCTGTSSNITCANMTLPAGLNPSCAMFVCNNTLGCILLNATIGTSCSDNASCSVNDVCDGLGHCVGTLDNNFCETMSPSFNNDCVNGTCNPTSPFATPGTGCVFTNNSLPCNDGIPCTNNDTCSSGLCRGTYNDTICINIALGIGMCVVGQCRPDDPFYDPGSGCTFTFVQAGDPCNDGLACTYNDTCMNGVCVGTSNNTQCLDTLPMGMESVCVTPLCLPYGIGCLYLPKPSGTPCNDSQPADNATCTDKRCQSSTSTCEEVIIPGFCDVVGECLLGVCQPGNPFANTTTGCATYVINTCNDHIPCTDDICSGGNCTSTPNNNFCLMALPNPNNTCIQSVCNASAPGADMNGCVYTNLTNGSPCDDGFTCTDDSCINGVCVGIPDNVTCPAFALIMGGCNNGTCNPSSPNATSDGCVFTALSVNNTCDDMIPCTYNDTCSMNDCEGTPNDTYCVQNIPGQYDASCVMAICDHLAGCLYIPLANTTSCVSDGFSCTNDHCNGIGQCVHTSNNTACPAGSECASFVCAPTFPGADMVTGCVATVSASGIPCTSIPNDNYTCTERVCNGLGSCVQMANDSLCPLAGGCTVYACNTTSPDADNTTGCVPISVGTDPTIFLNLTNQLALQQASIHICADSSPVCMTGPANPSSFWNNTIPASSLPAAPPTVPPINCTLIGGTNYNVACVRNYAAQILLRLSRGVDCELNLDKMETLGAGASFSRMCECEALCGLNQTLPTQCAAADPWAQNKCGLGADSATGNPSQIAAVKHITCATLQMIVAEMQYALGLLQTLTTNCTADDNLSFIRRFPNTTYWASMQYEDTLDNEFDFDYNDFIMWMYIVEAFDSLGNLISIYIDMLPVARGSSYEHKLFFAHDGNILNGSPNLQYVFPTPVAFGNYTILIEKHSTNGTYISLESSQGINHGGADSVVIASTMGALMNPTHMTFSDYFVNTRYNVPLKKPEYSYHLYIQCCNSTLNNAATRPYPNMRNYYFYLRSVAHFDQTPILYDVPSMTVFNGADILDVTGHPFGLVSEALVNWPIELYTIDPRFPGFLELRDWLLDPVANSPLSPTGQYWFNFPNPSQCPFIIDSSNVPIF